MGSEGSLRDFPRSCRAGWVESSGSSFPSLVVGDLGAEYGGGSGCESGRVVDGFALRPEHT